MYVYCLCLLKTDQYQNPAKKRSLSEYNPNDIRYDGLNHDKMKNSRGRCTVCKKIHHINVQDVECVFTMT